MKKMAWSRLRELKCTMVEKSWIHTFQEDPLIYHEGKWGKGNYVASCLIKSINGTKELLVEWGFTDAEATVFLKELINAEETIDKRKICGNKEK